MSKKLNSYQQELLADGSFITNKVENMANEMGRMLECDDITIAQQKELKIARKALLAAWNTLAKNTHL